MCLGVGRTGDDNEFVAATAPAAGWLAVTESDGVGRLVDTLFGGRGQPW